MRHNHGIGALGIAVVVAACHRGSPPGADVDASASGLPVPELGAAVQASEAGAPIAARGGDAPRAPDASVVDAATTTDDAADTTAPNDASADAGAADGATDAEATSGAVLGQTHDKPSAATDAFNARMKAVWEAIAEDDPDRAAASFFPLEAYERVKAIATPARDWRYRLMGNFKRDIHALHAELGRAADRATFVRVDLPEARVRWIEPGEETNAVGYYRVYGTRIIYDVDGKERSVGVTSLISWRGEWYVVHLTGFK